VSVAVEVLKPSISAVNSERRRNETIMVALCYDGSMSESHEAHPESIPMQVPPLRPSMAEANREATRALPELQAAALGYFTKRKISADQVAEIQGRLLSSVTVSTSGCWIWQKNTTQKGYGNVTVLRRSAGAHQLSLAVFAGVVAPSGYVIDHKCRVRHCINPSHLRIVTAQQNVTENSVSIQAENRNKTHCIRGHEFTAENTRIVTVPSGNPWRECRECSRERCRQRREIARKGGIANGKARKRA
jgi:hypothetical protein